MISMDVKFGGELHKLIMQSLRDRIRSSDKHHSERRNKWKLSEDLLSGYVPEREVDAARKEKREGGMPEYTTIQLPYTYAVVMAAHSYWSTVFLSRSPVFQFMGTTGEGEDQVLALEALLNYQVIKGRMLAPLFIWLQDFPKYGEGWVSPYWRMDRQRTCEIVEEEVKYLGLVPSGKFKKVKRYTETMGYQGNTLYNVSPANVYTDPRYSRGRFQEGEFIAIKSVLSMGQLAEGKAKGQYINVDKLYVRGKVDVSFDMESSKDAESSNLERPDVTAYTSDLNPNVLDTFEVFEFVVNLIPNKWRLGNGDLPEKWVFTTTTDFKVLLECRPQGNLHNKFPLGYLEIEPEAYARFSRSLTEVFGPIQNTLDWLVNSHFYNVRQALNNQWVLDPSRVEIRDLQNGKPGKAIRLKPQAYGTDTRTAIHQLPVMDVTQGHLTDMNMIYQFGERLGVSDLVMGAGSHPSSRRSATEVRGDQTFSVSRLKTIAEYASATGFTDISAMMIANSQQYYDGELKLKIVGDAAEIAGQEFLNVTPESIVGEFGFLPVDGTLPVDRYAQANLWREMIAQMAQVPQVISQYDLGKIFAYVAQLSGLKNINRFRVDIVPDEQMLAQVQAGNSVQAMGDPTMLLEPGQVPGMGPTG